MDPRYGGFGGEWWHVAVAVVVVPLALAVWGALRASAAQSREEERRLERAVAVHNGPNVQRFMRPVQVTSVDGTRAWTVSPESEVPPVVLVPLKRRREESR